MKKLFIISNESVLNYEGKFFCNNIDTKIISEGLNSQFQTNLIARKSKIKRSHCINLNNVKIYSTIFTFLIGIYKTFHENEENKYLIISINPFTFFASILIKIFKKKSVVYLRSDGYGEYKSILGFIGPIIYYVMFNIVTNILPLISCRTYILKGKKGNVVSPSLINKNWLTDNNEAQINKTKLLYVGRLRVEKGIFSFLKIFKESNSDQTLTIVGSEKNSINKINQLNVTVCGIESDEKKLINIYDNHNIFILPSFTEGHPMVLLEALARLRPVIIFPEIAHIVGNKKGIFVAERNSKNFFEKTNFIIKNYQSIQNEMKKNQLPTKDQFLQEFGKLIYKI
jgi:glycosyltransferase involved in cell wall biosynthesis